MVGAEMPPRSRGGFPLAGARAGASHVWVSLILGLILLPGSWARSGGRVSGTVRDRSNAVIPKASVKATNSQTGAEQQMLTDSRIEIESFVGTLSSATFTSNAKFFVR